MLPITSPDAVRFRHLLLLAAALALVAAGLVVPTLPVPAASAVDNPVVTENRNPGTTDWRIPQSGYRIADEFTRQIEGYASATSVNKGERIDLRVRVSTAQSVGAKVYRLGWYGGTGGRFMADLGTAPAYRQGPCPMNATTGMIACSWPRTFSFTVPMTWTSGIYLVVLSTADRYQRYATFTVRDDARSAALLYQQPVTTYQAYNRWPVGSGKSLYTFNSVGATVPATGTTRAAKVSFDRPYDDGYGAAHLVDPAYAWEQFALGWLERNGYDVTYSTDADTEANPARLRTVKGVLSVGHDEYWSRPMLDAFIAARDAGVNLAFLGSNTAYWQIRFEPSTTGVARRVVVCYKSATADPVKDQTSTVLFRDPPANYPEQQLVGVQYTAHVLNDGVGTPYLVTNPANWVWAGTGVGEGTAIPGVLGYETDRLMSEYPAPVSRSQTLLASTPVTDAAGVPSVQNSSIYQAPSGAWVFATGSNHWSLGLGKPGVADPRVQRATATVLNRFLGIAPPVDPAPSPTSSAASSATPTATTTASPTATATPTPTPTPTARPTPLFSESFTGPDGSPWSSLRWKGSMTSTATWGLLGGGGRMGVGNSTDDAVQATAVMPARADTETLLSYRVTSTGPRAYLYLFARGSGTWVGGYPSASYFVQVATDSTAVTLWKSVAGVTTSLAGNATAAAVTTSRQWVRLRVQGSTLGVRVWTEGTPEPTTWEVTATDAAVPAAGIFQTKVYRSPSSTAPREFVLDDLTITELTP